MCIIKALPDDKQIIKLTLNQGYGVGVVGSRRFLDRVGVGVGILRVLGVGVGIFYPTPTPKDQLNSFSTCFACLFLLLRPI